MNSVILIGRLTKDPELAYTPSNQTAVTRFTLAVDRPRRQGEDQGADFIRVTVFGKQAENCNRYLSKGRQAAVLGRIQTGSYTNREGQKVYTTDVVADRIEFLGGGNGENFRSDGFSEQSGGNYQPQGYVPQNGNNQVAFSDLPQGFSAVNEDIPFNS